MGKQSSRLKNQTGLGAPQFRRRLERALPDEAERLRFLNYFESDRPLTQKILRFNSLKPPTNEERSKLKFEVFGDEPTRSPPWSSDVWFIDPVQVRKLDSHPAMGAGLIFIQEAGAHEVVSAFEIRPDMRVLDMCAAPGAKSTQLAERLGNTGWLLANEPDSRRAKKLDAILARHGASRVTIYAASGERLPHLVEPRFDAILIDAPCSGESLLFKRNDDRTDIHDADVKRLVQLQTKLLEAAAKLATPGAQLIYSTCTYGREENEDRIENFLRAHPDWVLVREQRRWPHLDQMAGGYWALLKLKGDENLHTAEAAIEREEVDSTHLVRHGLVAWNGEIDKYARAMDASQEPGARARFDLTSTADLKLYLQGEVLILPHVDSASEECDVFWNGRAVGIGKQVPGRLNNLLPKTLKAGL